MIDADGRGRLVALLRSLADDGIAVVHITHDAGEAEVADRVLRLSDGRVVDALPAVGEALTDPTGHLRTAWPVVELRGEALTDPTGHLRTAWPVVELRGVGHVYAAGSPWAHRALTAVDFAVHGGECVLVVGANGSGKSTLAGVLAGLTEPTEGTAEVRGAAVASRLGTVGLAFQHARLQLLRDTVRAEVRSAAGVDDWAADVALRDVGLDPAVHGERRIDELSGGELRRAALAGLLARRPQVLVLDEPFAGLDPAGRVALVEVLDRIVAAGCAVVVISHDLAAVGLLADRLVELDGGRVVAARDLVGGTVA
jgi:energy-coupling factor transport system ATP-binding protein